MTKTLFDKIHPSTFDTLRENDSTDFLIDIGNVIPLIEHYRMRNVKITIITEYPNLRVLVG